MHTAGTLFAKMLLNSQEIFKLVNEGKAGHSVTTTTCETTGIKPEKSNIPQNMPQPLWNHFFYSEHKDAFTNVHSLYHSFFLISTCTHPGSVP